MSRSAQDAWRANVVAVVVDAAGNVLLGGNPQVNKHWHFPQGGVKDGELFSAAVMRELWEESGLPPFSCSIVARFSGLRYKYRDDNPKSERWRGNEQAYFLISCEGVQPAVEARKGCEFSCFTWMPWRLLNADLFPPVKRKSIRPALEAFFPQGQGFSLDAVAARLSPERYKLVVSDPVLRQHDPQDRALFGGGKEEAAAELDDLAYALKASMRTPADPARRTVLLLFGLPGCGMRGALRHIAGAVDPLSTRLHAPLADRPAPDFLWELHCAIPAPGGLAVLHRGPYDSLLAAHATMDPAAWARRAAHLVDFEAMLAEEGVRLIKAFLHISEEKFLEEETDTMSAPAREAALADWRRQSAAAQQLLAATHHPAAPWYIIPSDRRWYRNMVLSRLLTASYAV